MSKNKNKNKQNPNTSIPGSRTPAQAVRQQPATRKNVPSNNNSKFLDKYSNWLIPLVIGLLTYLFYQTCLNNQLTNWDDLGYIISNPLIKDNSAQGIKNIFSIDHPVMGNYHPLTILLYNIEYSYVGLQPWLYHFDSIILQVLITIAVYFFVKKLTGRTVAATVVALLFGLHPMHVESVAWAAGRKDILYGLFFVLSMTSYVFYLRTEGSKKTFWYASVLVLFALSLLAKSVAVTLPVTLFGIDFLEKRKLSAAFFLEKIPLFGLALLFGLLSIRAQKDVGAMTLDAHFNFIERAALGCYALCTYLWKVVIPVGLSNFYPYPLKVADALPASYYGYLAIVVALIVAIVVFARKNRVVLFGVGFFIVNIVLLLQFIPVGGAIISDRYGYIPYLGLFFIVGWYVSNYFEVKEKIPTGKILLGITVVYSLVLGAMTNERCKDWYDAVSLWKDDIEKHPEAPVGYFYLGQEYFSRYELMGDPAHKKALGDSALVNFKMSVDRKPDYINPIICIAELQRSYNQVDEAKITYNKALKINDKNESVYLGLGVVYAIKQQFDSAQYAFKKALDLKPFSPEGHSNYANFFDIIGKQDSALNEYAIAISQNPDAYIPYMNRARIYMRQTKFDEAIKDFNRALAILDLNKEMDHTAQTGEIMYLRAKTFYMKGDKAQAMKDINEAKAKGYSKIDMSFFK